MRNLIRLYGTIRLLACDEIYDESLELIWPADRYQQLYPVARNGTLPFRVNYRAREESLTGGKPGKLVLTPVGGI